MNIPITKTLLFLLAFSLSSDVYCQRLTNKTMEYQLIKLEEIEDSVKSWYFNFGSVKTGSNKIAILNKFINWIDVPEPKSIPLPKGYVNSTASRGKNYLGVISLTESSKEKTGEKIYQLQVYSITGKKLYEIKRTQYYDDSLPSLIISDKDGSVILGQNSRGKLWFYNWSGTLSKQIDLFSDDVYDLERILQLDLTLDVQYLAVLASKRGASPIGAGTPNPSGEPYLFLFTLDGKEIWRLPLSEFGAGQMAISPDGEYIIVSSYTTNLKGNIKKRTSLFDKYGQEIKGFDFLFRNFRFSPDSKYLILAERTVVNLLELKRSKISWSQNIPRKQGMITAVDISKNGEYALLLVAKNEFKDGSFIFTNPKLVVLDRSGKKVQDINIEGGSFYSPALSFAAYYKNIVVGLKNSYRIYGIVAK